MAVKDAASLLTNAARYRRLAAEIAPQRSAARESLLELAAELEVDAAGLCRSLALEITARESPVRDRLLEVAAELEADAAAVLEPLDQPAAIPTSVPMRGESQRSG